MNSALTRAPAAPVVAMPTHLVGVLEFKVDHALADGVEAIELLHAPVCGQHVRKSVGQCVGTMRRLGEQTGTSYGTPDTAST